MGKKLLLKVLVLSVVMIGVVSSSPAFGADASEKLRVVTTIFPFADWAQQVGGDKVEVVCLLPPGASPHTYELTTKDIKALQQAKILIYNGMGLDDWVGKLVEKSANQGLIKLAMAEQLPLAPMPSMIEAEEKGTDNDHEEVVHAEGDHQEKEGEPHEVEHRHHDHTAAACGMWLDPMRAVRMVDLIAAALSEADPANRAYYQERAKRYWAQLDRLDRQYRRTLESEKGGVICFHDAFIYLFRRYNVDIYGIVEPYPGKEPSVEYIRRLTSHVADRPLRYVLTEPQLSVKPAKVLADQLKVPAVTVDPIGGYGIPQRDSYIGLMSYNLKQLTKK
jgi:zinc transport system substrate-binding protein